MAGRAAGHAKPNSGPGRFPLSATAGDGQSSERKFALSYEKRWMSPVGAASNPTPLC